MKITTMVSIPCTEIEVHIDGNDIVAAILGETEGWRPEQLIKRIYNDVAAFMLKMPDAELAKLSAPCRKLMVDFFDGQAARLRGIDDNGSL